MTFNLYFVLIISASINLIFQLLFILNLVFLFALQINNNNLDLNFKYLEDIYALDILF